MKTLLVGYKAADLSRELLEGDVTCHTLDIYHRHAIEKVWHAKAICSPHLPEGPWDLIRFKTGPALASGELSLDLLQEIHRLLSASRDGDGGVAVTKGPADGDGGVAVTKGGGVGSTNHWEKKFKLDFVGEERDRNSLLDKIRKDPDRVRDFSAKWFASVPGGPKLEFTSYPGCFCHRRLDEGGLALAEVVSRELLNPSTPQPLNPQPSTLNPLNPQLSTLNPLTPLTPLNLLDMGCGCGLVGFLVASALRSGVRGAPALPGADGSAVAAPSALNLTMVDSHSRAVEAAEVNSRNFGMPAEIILSDSGTPPRMDGTFDVFVGNPPYYSDYRIAEVFLETARRALKPGGVCYTVCKNAAGLEPVQRRYFPNVEIIRRRGYSILKSRIAAGAAPRHA